VQPLPIIEILAIRQNYASYSITQNYIEFNLFAKNTAFFIKIILPLAFTYAQSVKKGEEITKPPSGKT